MTTPPLPIDTSDINTPLPDAGHEAIRVAVLNSLHEFWTQHLALIDQVNALTTRVAALEPHGSLALTAMTTLTLTAG